jgi:hypothetical protein
MVAVPRWLCPECGRQFARRNQGHECAPAMTLEEYFASGPERERPIYEVVKAHLDTVGPVFVEPLSVGIFLKRARSFAQLRPMTKWVALSFSLGRTVTHPLIVRKPVAYNGRYHHVVNVRGPEDVDDRIKDWLTEAYLASPE